MATRKFFVEPGTKASVLAILALGVIAIASFAYRGLVRSRERELADAFREIGTAIVDAGMTPRQAIAFARTKSPVSVEIGTSLADRNADAFKSEDMPEAFDSASSISFGTRLPPLGIYGTNVYGSIDFENKRAVKWSVGGIGTIEYDGEIYSGRRK